ncbi:hypothetical protein CKF54_02630 [Psittacicella hinzii]|uniref:Uncharacterized protein n=1 Tax=Psittacicella hinzii TaxID=2028575 RepID=A0A3A1Y5I8_9GAMM|nr:FUSC family membrane protein [Psittacicella hinzii]RIY33523.1 hypothetical protein CKF54_02630 [Psittacicella hinzii]
MATKFKSIIKYQWVNILPTFISTSMVLTFLSTLGLYSLYLPMCLGLIAGGLVDIDNKFSGKVKNAFLIFLTFLIAEALVLYTFHNLYLMWGVALVASFVFVMSGVFSNSLKTVGFGGVLILCYSIFLCFGASDFTEAVENLLFMLFAAMFYTGTSLLVHVLFPNRGIKNNVSDLYNSLSEFLTIKSSFFDPDDEIDRRAFTATEQESSGEFSENTYYNRSYEKARNSLIEQFEIGKSALLIRIKSFGKRKTTSDMLRYYLTADNIFKTLDFNLQDYQALKDRLQDSDIMFRIQRILMLYASAAAQFSYDLKTDRIAVLDKRILISIERLEASISKQRSLHYYHVDSLQLLLTKLKKVYWLLQNINNNDTFKQSIQQFTPEKGAKVGLKFRIQALLDNFTLTSPTFRHAIRVGLMILMSAFVFHVVDVQFAFWFMMAGVLVIQPRYSLTKLRVKHRVYGSIFGALLGACLAFPVETMPLELCLAAVITLTLFQVTKVLNYGYSTMFLTMSVFCTFRLAGLELTPVVVIERILANTMGAGLCYLVMNYVFPEWKYLSLDKNVRQVYADNKGLLLSLVGVLLKHPITPFDLNKRYLRAQNSHLALQSVVSNIVSEPKIYSLYITPSIKFMALNDYIVSNMSLINQLIIEAYENDKLEQIDDQTIVQLERLALIFAKLYNYGDQELRDTIGEFVKEANELANNSGFEEDFDLNFYLNEKIVGIAVSLINYRRELAQIYQVCKVDQRIEEQSASENNDKAKAGALAENNQEQAPTEQDDKVEVVKANSSEEKAEREAQTSDFIRQAAQHSINDIRKGVNSEQVEQIVAHHLGQEVVNADSEEDKKEEEVTSNKKSSLEDNELLTDVNYDRKQTDKLVNQELKQTPQTEEDELIDYLTVQEAKLAKQIDQDVQNNLNDELTRIEENEQNNK